MSVTLLGALAVFLLTIGAGISVKIVLAWLAAEEKESDLWALVAACAVGLTLVGIA